MNTLLWTVDGSFSTRLTMALLHILWQGCCGGILVIVGGALLRSASAHVRYALNVAAMLLMAICLPVTFCVLDIPNALVDKAAARQNVHDLHVANSAQDGLPTTSAVQIDPSVSELAEPREAIAESSGRIEAGRSPANALGSNPSSRVSRPEFRSVLTAYALQSISRWVATLYLLGVVLILGRLLRGVWGGHRLRKLASVIKDEALLATVGKLSHRLGLKVAPTVAWCEQISIPVVVGVLKPMILLPMAVVSGLTTNQLQALMLHELAHIRRFDPIVNLFQRIIEAVLFFHPVVWFVSRRISFEREKAADDMVLAAGWDRPVYADALVRMAELSAAFSRSGAARHAAVLGAAGTSPTEFKLRVLRLLDDSHQPELQLSRAGMLTMLLVVTFGGFFAWSQTGKSKSTSHRSSAVEVRDSEPGVAIKNRPPIADRHANRTVAKVAENNPPASDAAKNVVQAASEQDESAAVKQLELLGGRCIRDDTLPGRPVKRILFRGSSLFGDQHVHLLKSFPHLSELNLTWTLCTDVGMKTVGELTRLKKLVIAGNQFTDVSLKHVGRLKDLTMLGLGDSKKITDVGVKQIARLKNLTTLHLTNCVKISDAGVKEIARLKNLTALSLYNSQVTDACLKDLGDLSQLTRLQLIHAKVTDAGLLELAKLKNLNMLELYGTDVTGLGLKDLAGLSHLNQLFLGHARITDTGMKGLRELKNLTTLYLDDTQITDVGIKELRSLTNLTKLNLSGTAVTDAGIEELQQAIPGAQILAGSRRPKRLPRTAPRAEEAADEATATARIKPLGGLVTTDGALPDRPVTAIAFRPESPFDDNDVPVLKSFKHLTKLSLSNTLITDAGINQLGSLKALTELKLDKTKITNVGLEALAGLPNLKVLSLQSCDQITNAGLQELGKLKNLIELNLESCDQITDVGARDLKSLKKLKKITVSSTEIGDAGVKDVCQLENLTSFILGGNAAQPETVTDASARDIGRLHNLTSLTLWSKRVTDVGVKELGRLKNLESLNLQMTQITEAGAKELARLENLTSLTVVGPQITDAAVKEISRLEHLKYLLVAGAQITDVGVEELRQLKSLTKLVVGSPKVTDVGAKELGTLKSLKSLDLTSCSQVTAAAIAELRKALPDAQIPRRQNRSHGQRK